MPLVINWKVPPALKTREMIETYLQENDIAVTVRQCHRVPSGKMNITVEGEPQAEMDFWRLVKDTEKEAIKQRGVKVPIWNRH